MIRRFDSHKGQDSRLDSSLVPLRGPLQPPILQPRGIPIPRGSARPNHPSSRDTMTTPPDRSGPNRLPNGTFLPGQSGNPAGRPRRGTCLTTAIVKSLDASDPAGGTRRERLAKLMIDMALAGDVRFAVEIAKRDANPGTGAGPQLDLPKLVDASSCMDAMSAIFAAIGTGDLDPTEAQKLAAVVELARKSIETLSFDRRLVALEEEKEYEA